MVAIGLQLLIGLGGAIPDGNNVARVIIPTNSTVVYNSDQVGVTGSAISNSDNIILLLPIPST